MEETKKKAIQMYSKEEERLNIWSHGLGIILSLFALGLLMWKASLYNEFYTYVSFFVFGISMICLYTASTTYHSATDPKKRFRLKIFDHISIFIFIAGTYTPYALVTMRESNGWMIFFVVWGIAIFGALLKIFFTGRFKLLSTLLYVGMGWIVVFSFSSLSSNLGSDGVFWLIAGGIAYTIGAIFYSIGRLKFNHAIFHIFVLIGTLCHFLSIYLYVHPKISI